MLFYILLFTAPFLVHVNGFVDTPADPVVMKTLNTHGDRISDLELIVKRLLASNQDLQKLVTDLQKAVTALQTENTVLKAAMQAKNSNCCCTSQVSCQQAQNTSTSPPVTKTSSVGLHQSTTSSTSTASPMSRKPMTTNMTSTTTKVTTSGRTQPPVPTTCFVCLDDAPVLCDQLYVEEVCNPPNNYCVNQIANLADGSKTIERSCANVTTCQQDWLIDSSVKDVCQNFDEYQYITLDFQCTYCCTENYCNDPMKPASKTLYRGTK